ncbi:hypothetical protein JJB11_12140 [Ramlibacter ginsenosidimutans]|uniref:Uncharacterized protein n=1 Tax=Ramlibacter ginsenosidimutans TaxID=502333 RepID=A0A934TTP9_9BURK|nr:hypothetical protein [Ramlibacter ginsenosidimutans]MBK6006841.1 hypothetical protein [Ramlibacter ginsenosidimutans]
MFNRNIAVALLSTCVAQALPAETSRDNAMLARAVWAAFECTSLASEVSDSAEQERLFLYGYNAGKRFIAAVRAHQIQEDDFKSEVPWIMGLLLQGPSADFMLGRIYAAAEHEALKDVLATDGRVNRDEMKLMLAKSSFERKNCRLLGR